MSTALRIGDAEREAAISSLASHFAEGRLTQVEHEERTELALNARTGRDLDVLFADLPPARRRDGRHPASVSRPSPRVDRGAIVWRDLHRLRDLRDPEPAADHRDRRTSDHREPVAVRYPLPPALLARPVRRYAAPLVGQAARLRASTGIVRIPVSLRSYSANPGFRRACSA